MPGDSGTPEPREPTPGERFGTRMALLGGLLGALIVVAVVLIAGALGWGGLGWGVALGVVGGAVALAFVLMSQRRRQRPLG